MTPTVESAPTTRPARDVILTAVALPFFAAGYLTLWVQAGWRWVRESFKLGREAARKRWPHAR